MLQQAPKGSLVIHALVPGMCNKGQRKLARRARLVADAISELWKKRFPAARKDSNKEQLLLLLQIMQFSPNVAAVVSLSKCQRGMMLWPNPNLPVGLPNVDVDMKMPSSAYRKLLEAFACWQCMPTFDNVVVDLGASPGGWTFAVLKLHCEPRKIIAVDRAKLDRRLMNHSQVEFVQGDAFTFRPLQQASRLDDERYHCLPGTNRGATGSLVLESIGDAYGGDCQVSRRHPIVGSDEAGYSCC